MKALISLTCILVSAFVVYYFFNEFSSRRNAEVLRENIEQVRITRLCDGWIEELNSWKNGKPIGKANSFYSARTEVDNCLMRLKNTSWYDQNIKSKYW